jgi:hypothetical protein
MIRFNPWQGDTYSSAPFGKKVLILGESHYSWKGSGDISSQHDLTIKCVREQLSSSFTKAFWTNVAIMFLNYKPMHPQKLTFWHSVAFYNYVQYSAGDGPRIAPKPETWKNSAGAFFQVLELLKPQLIVALGYRLWRQLPNENRGPIEKLPDFHYVNTARYDYASGSCFTVSIRHPSSGFNGRGWYPVISKAISMA